MSGCCSGIWRAYFTHLYEHLPRTTTVADLEALLPWSAAGHYSRSPSITCLPEGLRPGPGAQVHPGEHLRNARLDRDGQSRCQVHQYELRRASESHDAYVDASLTRLTNGFSKKLENLGYAVALHFMYYNFARIHQTLRVTPTMDASMSIMCGSWKKSQVWRFKSARSALRQHPCNDPEAQD